MSGKFVETAKGVLGFMGMVALTAAYATGEVVLSDYRTTVKYGDAIEAITKSDMYSSDIARVIKVLPENGTSEFYKAVMSIVNSDMWSSEKAKVILSMCEKQ